MSGQILTRYYKYATDLDGKVKSINDTKLKGETAEYIATIDVAKEIEYYERKYQYGRMEAWRFICVSRSRRFGNW